MTSFEIEGTRAISASELRDHLVTQPSGRFMWQDPEYFDEDALANDRRRIVRYYQARGYYQARVESAEAIPDGPGRVKVRIRVSEGVPARVVALELDGLEGAPEARAKLQKLPLRKGDVFTETAYDATRAAILGALTSTGWAKAEVAQHADIEPALGEARVRYVATPGERYRFGGVFVAGASAIPRARIREEAELATPSGGTFDATALPKAQARVFDLGVFGGVRVGQGPPDPQKGTVPVVVSVREAPFRTIRAGPGFTLQATRSEVDAYVGWSHRNWLGGLRKLNLDLRAGYAWLPSWWKPTKQGVVGLASADFTQPGILARNVDLNVRTELERGLDQAYDFWAQRLRFGTPIRFGRTVTIIPSYNLEVYELSGQVSQADPATGSVLLLSTCPGSNPNLCLLSYFEQRLTLDFRDDPILTTKGVMFSVALQEGFGLFSQGATYLRLLPEVRAFASLGAGMVLAGRIRMGFVKGFEGQDVPSVAKFTSGGPNLMRGYYTRQLSPVLLSNGEYIPVGGNGLVEGSVELRYPITGHLGGSVFLDTGNTTSSAADALNLANLQYAVGAGLRYMTVFGPIRLDVAGRLPIPGGEQPGVELMQLQDAGGGRSTLVRVGTHNDPIVSIHLSIGEAF